MSTSIIVLWHIFPKVHVGLLKICWFFIFYSNRAAIEVLVCRYSSFRSYYVWALILLTPSITWTSINMLPLYFVFLFLIVVCLLCWLLLHYSEIDLCIIWCRTKIQKLQSFFSPKPAAPKSDMPPPSTPVVLRSTFKKAGQKEVDAFMCHLCTLFWSSYVCQNMFLLILCAGFIAVNCGCCWCTLCWDFSVYCFAIHCFIFALFILIIFYQ